MNLFTSPRPRRCETLVTPSFQNKISYRSLPLLATPESKSVKRKYGFLHDNLPRTLSLWYLFTVTSPNMDFKQHSLYILYKECCLKSIFGIGQLKKLCHALGFWNFALCVARSGKTPAPV